MEIGTASWLIANQEPRIHHPSFRRIVICMLDADCNLQTASPSLYSTRRSDESPIDYDQSIISNDRHRY